MTRVFVRSYSSIRWICCMSRIPVCSLQIPITERQIVLLNKEVCFYTNNLSGCPKSFFFDSPKVHFRTKNEAINFDLQIVSNNSFFEVKKFFPIGIQ